MQLNRPFTAALAKATMETTCPQSRLVLIRHRHTSSGNRPNRRKVFFEGECPAVCSRDQAIALGSIEKKHPLSPTSPAPDHSKRTEFGKTAHRVHDEIRPRTRRKTAPQPMDHRRRSFPAGSTAAVGFRMARLAHTRTRQAISHTLGLSLPSLRQHPPPPHRRCTKETCDVELDLVASLAFCFRWRRYTCEHGNPTITLTKLDTSIKGGSGPIPANGKFTPKPLVYCKHCAHHDFQTLPPLLFLPSRKPPKKSRLV